MLRQWCAAVGRVSDAGYVLDLGVFALLDQPRVGHERLVKRRSQVWEVVGVDSPFLGAFLYVSLDGQPLRSV